MQMAHPSIARIAELSMQQQAQKVLLSTAMCAIAMQH
jgi:hypothetical protein